MGCYDRKVTAIFTFFTTHNQEIKKRIQPSTIGGEIPTIVLHVCKHTNQYTMSCNYNILVIIYNVYIPLATKAGYYWDTYWPAVSVIIILLYLANFFFISQVYGKG